MSEAVTEVQTEQVEAALPQEAEPYVPPIPRVSIQAFCETEDVAAVLQRMSEDRRLSRAHVTVQMGGLDMAVSYYQSAPTPNLIMLESTLQPEPMLRDLQRLADVCDAGTKVVLIGHVNDVLLYRELIKRGVSEYIVAPVRILPMIQTVAALYGNPDAEPVGRVMAFLGAKGGAGASTIAHNTAWMIARNLKSDVVIADLDLPFGTASLDFNQDPPQGIAEAVTAPDRLDDVLLDRLLAKCTDNLSLFAAPASLDREFDLDSQSVETVINVVRSNVPHVVLDIPHLWTGWVRDALMRADDVVIVAEPDLANLRNAKNLVDLIKQGRPNDREPFLVLNKISMPKRPEISPKDFGEAMSMEPVELISFDPQLFGSAANNGQMIQEVAPNSKPMESFNRLAVQLTGKTEPKRKRGSLFAPLLGKLKRNKG